ncbi:hypothetical protein Ciccas_006568 [Cichlidogyrus casuarinus]|uniref:Uncharacterized protein n=1 Tax=Cichlidogyrus casuarinus TaxID=1844966 RepID=A0ABD2Q5E3_9PLAT
MKTLFLAAVMSLLWVPTESLKPFCLPDSTAEQCVSLCKSAECDRGLKLIGDIVTCLGTSLTEYVNKAVSLTNAERQKVVNFIRTDVGNLGTNVATIKASFPTQPDSFFQDLVSDSATSVSAFIDTAQNVLNTAKSYENDICPREVGAFEFLLKEYNLTSKPHTSDATLLRRSNFFNCIVLAILSTIL